MSTVPSVADLPADPLPLRQARTSAGRAGLEGAVFDVTVDRSALARGRAVSCEGGA
ncbi:MULTISPECIES: hypothetical protein [Streptomyces]|uniref:Uncharacterized protein n=1 Tax=Streptomyces lienomycini TaxID=284035 RepID=A0ABV9X4R9_9ACTN|nr:MULTISPECIES: hypothetical protein [Streptomyces]